MYFKDDSRLPRWLFLWQQEGGRSLGRQEGQMLLGRHCKVNETVMSLNTAKKKSKCLGLILGGAAHLSPHSFPWELHTFRTPLDQAQSDHDLKKSTVCW